MLEKIIKRTKEKFEGIKYYVLAKSIGKTDLTENPLYTFFNMYGIKRRYEK